MIGMPERQTWHVTPAKSEGWQVKHAGKDRATSRHGTKDDAVQAAKTIAKKRELGQVIVHKRDGTIQQEFTYGEDPVSSKG